MSEKTALRDALSKLVAATNEGKTVTVFAGEVTAVDEGKRVCSVLSTSLVTDVLYENVNFMPSVSDGVMFVPKKGSDVVVVDPKNVNPYILMWSEIDRVQFIVNDTVLNIEDGLTTFNDGAFAGLVKVVPLTSALNKLEQDVTTLKSLLAGVLGAISGAAAGPGAGTPVTNGTLNGFLSPLLPYTTSAVPLTTQASIEDTKVVH